MRFWNSIPLCLCLTLTSCHKAVEEAPPNTLHLVMGAAQVPYPKDRDQALAEACQESANQGDGPATLMGIPQIQNPSLRDSVAESCAITLNDSGKAEAAIDVAKLIKDQSKRDQVLASFGE